MGNIDISGLSRLTSTLCTYYTHLSSTSVKEAKSQTCVAREKTEVARASKSPTVHRSPAIRTALRRQLSGNVGGSSSSSSSSFAGSTFAPSASPIALRRTEISVCGVCSSRLHLASARGIHTSARRYAQIAPDNTTRWEDDAPVAIAPRQSAHSRTETQTQSDHLEDGATPNFWDDPLVLQNAVASSSKTKTPASAAKYVQPAEYIPQDSDFEPRHESSIPDEAYDDPSTSSLTGLPALNAPAMPDWDPTTPSTRRRRVRPKRRNTVSDLPPLPIGELPDDGDTRFDWRQRALSQIRRKKVEGKRWFPGQERERVAAPNEKLEAGDVFHEELQRYTAHFEPLLLAEFAEERRIFNERLKEWPVYRLLREGFAIEDLGLSKAKWQGKSRHIIIYELKKVGKDAISALPMHRFEVGTTVILSRNDPLLDPVLEGGMTAKTEAEATEKKLLRATVHSVGRGYIRVRCEEYIEDFDQGKWRLDVGLSDMALRHQLKAIESLNADPVRQDILDMRFYKEASSRSPRPVSHQRGQDQDDAMMEVLSQSDPKLDMEQTILQGTSLRDRILRAFQEDFVPYESSTETPPSSSSQQPHHPHAVKTAGGSIVVPDGIVAHQKDLKAWDVDATPTPATEGKGIGWGNVNTATGVLARNLLIQNWAARYRANDGSVVRVDGDPDVGLNGSQMRAIAMMLSERLSLVQGPPGTGKTRVIIETIKLLKKHWQIPHPILVTAHTNVAVDNLLSGLRNHGVKAVRTGATDRVRSDLQEWTFDEVVQAHPLNEEVERLQEEKENLFRRGPDGQFLSSSVYRVTRSREISAKLHKKRSILFSEVLKDADVICTTLLSAANQYLLKHIDFPIVFLDEASMATEPLSLIPLMKGSSHVAIIGDHKQLPPVIISDAAKAGGLATSLFERLIHEKHVPSIMLDTQYRMHPAISAFPSQTFYNSDLRDGTVTPAGIVVKGFDTPVTSYLQDENGVPKSMIFVDHEHSESPQMKSIANYGDAEIVTDIVVDLLHSNPGMKGSDIGIITPYGAQIRVLDNHLNSDPVRTQAIMDVLGPERTMELEDVEIKTVDGFEGREKEVIVFSTVRSNSMGYIGFLADWRRLNVGVTRAKRGLIIVGSANTLENARVGGIAEDSLPQGGPQVWRDFIRYLKDRNLVIRR